MLSSVRHRPIKFVCDAPTYEVVKASASVGMHAPEDVRWRRQSTPKADTVKRESLIRRIWRLLFSFGAPPVLESCGCGSPLPERRFVLLHKRSGEKIRYSVTQCGRCHTIGWDEEHMSSQSQSHCGHEV